MKLSEKFDKLVEIMEILRSEKGCPQDRVQNHDTLKRYLLEETYELIEAIENKDPKSIKEELGDLILQIVFHSQIAKEQGNFDINDVIDSIIQKMIGRHPHVFGEADFKTPEEVLNQWDERKKKKASLVVQYWKEFLRHFLHCLKHTKFSQEWQKLALIGIMLME